MAEAFLSMTIMDRVVLVGIANQGSKVILAAGPRSLVLNTLNNTQWDRYNLPMVSTVDQSLLAWYAEHARDLPWRRQRDPYAVWVSEVMLQQTRVETVIPYYLRWMDRFPTVEVLAAASRDEVLGVWEGLGYYRRAHNLHHAARILVAEYGGELPSEVDKLRCLPGIGPYTSAAIAAIAFNRDVVALDGNLRRVISRLIDLPIDPRSQEGERQLRSWALGALPLGHSSVFNQALMDLGATVCVPRIPDCPSCPLAQFCLAFQRGVQDERPVRNPRRPTPHITAAAAVLRRGEQVFIGRRPEGMLLGGLWEFPGGRLEQEESLDACLRREINEELGAVIEVGATLGAFNHTYTHFRVTVHAFECELKEGEPQALEHSEFRWVYPECLREYPMGKIDRAIARTILEQADHPSVEG
jgi:A/G-specific adenine glycosylase